MKHENYEQPSLVRVSLDVSNENTQSSNPPSQLSLRIYEKRF